MKDKWEFEDQQKIEQEILERPEEPDLRWMRISDAVQPIPTSTPALELAVLAVEKEIKRKKKC